MMRQSVTPSSENVTGGRAQYMIKATTLIAPLVIGTILACAAATLAAAGPAFPLKPSANGRYLVDSTGQPFFYHADTVWVLPRKASLSVAEEYLDRRVKDGFTAVHFHTVSKEAGSVKNINGDEPFTPLNDILRPNPAYWAHLDSILAAAEKRGLLVSLSALWIRWGGTDREGWRSELTEQNARAYGQFLGARYTSRNNILWIVGGDANPGEKRAAVSLLAMGIKDKAPHHLITVHNSPEHSSAAFFGHEAWLDLNAAYTYREVHPPVLAEWNRPGAPRPIFLIESGYEDEGNDGRGGATFRVRRQAYGAILSGALMGHAYGHGQLWRFSDKWRETLDDVGSKQMRFVKELFASHAWWKLEPDQFNELVFHGRSKPGDDDYVTAARATDGSFALAYLPKSRTIHVDLGRFPAPVKAAWFDPTDGRLHSVEPSPLENHGARTFSPPEKNAAGGSDWILTLQVASASANTAIPAPGSRLMDKTIEGGRVGTLATGPLRVHPTNPRYFTDDAGKAIFLTGSHTWDSLQDWGAPTPNFDYPAYLDLLSGQGHNFIRLWIWESTGGNPSRPRAATPMPWLRTGDGKAMDGAPKFDLSQFNDAFFERLRARVMAARDRGIYVSIMLFQQYFNLRTHPFAASNNVNGLSADLNGDGDGREIHTLGHPAALACQEAFVRKVVDAVNDLDNVLYEIGNEFERDTIEWQYHMINLIHSYEREKSRQHPVGMTSTGRSGTAPPRITNAELFASPADWISPHNERGQNYATDPPAANGRKIVLADSDHLEGILGATDAATYRRWSWKCLFRGVQPILMDAIQNGIPGWEKETWNQTSNPAFPAAREAMGRVRAYAERLELAALVPHNDLASTRYCLADRGKEYVVFLPEGGEATVDLSAASGKLTVEWYRVEDGKSRAGDDIAGGKEIKLASPWFGHDVVLRLVRK